MPPAVTRSESTTRKKLMMIRLKTYFRLAKLKEDLKTELKKPGKRVTFSDVIDHLINHYEKTKQKRKT